MIMFSDMQLNIECLLAACQWHLFLTSLQSKFRNLRNFRAFVFFKRRLKIYITNQLLLAFYNNRVCILCI